MPKFMKYLSTGFKVLLLNIIAGLVTYVLNITLAAIGLVGWDYTALSPFNMFLAMLFTIMWFMVLISATGYVAQKIFRWK